MDSVILFFPKKAWSSQWMMVGKEPCSEPLNDLQPRGAGAWESIVTFLSLWFWELKVPSVYLSVLDKWWHTPEAARWPTASVSISAFSAQCQSTPPTSSFVPCFDLHWRLSSSMLMQRISSLMQKQWFLDSSPAPLSCHIMCLAYDQL